MPIGIDQRFDISHIIFERDPFSAEIIATYRHTLTHKHEIEKKENDDEKEEEEGQAFDSYHFTLHHIHFDALFIVQTVIVTIYIIYDFRRMNKYFSKRKKNTMIKFYRTIACFHFIR